MIGEISAAWAALNAAIKGAKATLDTVEDVKTKQAISDIQSSLLDVQAQLLAAQTQYEDLSKVKRELEEKLIAYEKWDSEASRYQLNEIAGGIFVYVLKPDDNAGEPFDQTRT